MQRMEKYASVVPGLLIAAAVAAAARFLEGLFPIHLIAPRPLRCSSAWESTRCASRLRWWPGTHVHLQAGDYFAGASLSMRDILTVGRLSLIVMCFTLLTCFGGGYLWGEAWGSTGS